MIFGLAAQIIFTHDCSNNRQCSHTIDPPNRDDSFSLKLEKIQLMIKECDSAVTWTVPLLVGMILPFPIIYYVNR